MIEKGAKSGTQMKWNQGMFYAARGGHKDIIELLIEKGAKSGTWMNWDLGMEYAAKGGHIDIVKLIRSYQK